MTKGQKITAVSASGFATALYASFTAVAAAGTGIAAYQLATNPALIQADPLQLGMPVVGAAAALLFGAATKNAAFDTRDALQGKAKLYPL